MNTDKLERAWRKHPRTMSIVLMVILPFLALRAAWEETSDDFKAAYAELWDTLKTGKTQ